jgi:acetylornithine deacetylase/succinyl-diaminopimelate desuccinylase-like protein
MEKLFNYIESNTDKSVAEIQELCRQPSISSQNLGIDECARMIRDKMQEIGMKSRVIKPKKGNPLVYGSLESRKNSKTLLFYNHYDVQPPEPLEEWSFDPFSATIKDGKIYARGVSDNKGNLAARLEAVRAILQAFGELPVNIKFVVEGEEEIGSPNLTIFVREYRSILGADACIWEGGNKDSSGRPAISLGYKGILYVELRVKTTRGDKHSMYAPIVSNPGWEMVWLLNTLKGRDGSISIEGFHKDVEKPSEGDIELIKSIPLDEKKYRDILEVDSFLGGLSGEELKKNLYLQPTCNICGLDSGYTGKGTKTILPNKASSKIDFRLVSNQHPDDVLGKLKRHLQGYGFKDVEVLVLGKMEPSKVSYDTPIAQLVIDSAKKVCKVEPVVYPMNAGSSPMYIFTNWLKIPSVSPGIVGHAGSNVHAPNENIIIEDYVQGIKHIALTIMSY